MDAPKKNSSVGYQVAPGQTSSTGSFVSESLANRAPVVTPTPVIGSEAASSEGGSRYDSGEVLGSNVQEHRANSQGTWAKIGARAARFLPDVALGIGEQVGYLGDLENYAGAVGAANTDFDNWLSKGARQAKEALGEVLPVYREDNEVFSPGDAGWWVDNAADLAESVAEFYVTGAGIGKALGAGAEALALRAGARNMAKAIQGAKGAESIVGAANTTNKLVNSAVSGANFATSTLQAYTGGVMQAQESYRNVYNDILASKKEDGSSYSEEEAADAASQAAASVVRWTTASTSLLNISSLAPIFRPFKREIEFADELGVSALSGAAEKKAGAVTSENLLEQLKLLKANGPAKEATQSIWQKLFHPEGVAFEMAQEATEEFLENAAQVAGENSASAKTGKVQDYFSKEALLAAALGAVGGGMGAGVMSAIDSRNEQVAPLQARFDKAIDDRIDALEKYKGSKEELANAVANKDRIGTLLAKSNLFSTNVFHSIYNDTDDLLRASYEDINKLDKDQAEAAGYDVDEKSPTYYKKTVGDAIAHLDTAKEVYNSVIADQTLPADIKSDLIGNMIGMSLYEQQQKNSEEKLESLYADTRLGGTQLEAKKLANRVNALETALNLFNRQSTSDSRSTSQSNIDTRLAIQSQLEQAKADQTRFKLNLSADEQSSLTDNKLPFLTTDASIFEHEINRAVNLAQKDKYSQVIKDYYNPKRREKIKAQVAKEKSDQQDADRISSLLDGYGVEVRDGVDRVTDQVDETGSAIVAKTPLSLGQVQDRLNNARAQVENLSEDSPHKERLTQRVAKLAEYVDARKQEVQAENEKVAKRKASVAKAQATRAAKRAANAQAVREEADFLRTAEQAESLSEELQRREEQSQRDKFAAAERSLPEQEDVVATRPINEAWTNQLAGNLTGPRLATFEGIQGVVDFENNLPTFIGNEGTAKLLDPELSFADQDILIHEGAATQVDVELLGGKIFSLIIAGEQYTIPHINPSDAIDFAGPSITLLNSKGEEVKITDEQLVYDVADPIMLLSDLMDSFLSQGEVLVELDGREYSIIYNHNDPLASTILTGKGKTPIGLPASYRDKSGKISRRGQLLDKVVTKFQQDVLSRITDVSPQNTELPGQAPEPVSSPGATQVSEPNSQAASGVSTTQGNSTSTAVAPVVKPYWSPEEFKSTFGKGAVESVYQIDPKNTTTGYTTPDGKFYYEDFGSIWEGEAPLEPRKVLGDMGYALPELIEKMAEWIVTNNDGSIVKADLALEINNAPMVGKVVSALQRIGILGKETDKNTYRILTPNNLPLALRKIEEAKIAKGEELAAKKRAKEEAAQTVGSSADAFVGTIITPEKPVVDPAPTVDVPTREVPVSSASDKRLQNQIEARIAAQEQRALENRIEAQLERAAKIAEDKAAEAEKRAKNKPKSKPTPNQPTSPTSGSNGVRIAPGTFTKNADNSLLTANGLPVVANPEENLVPNLLSDPSVNVGTKVSFELGTNNWWEKNKDLHYGQEWTMQPIFVLVNNKRVAKLEANNPQRQAIYQGLTKGSAVSATINGKQDANLINLKNDDGSPNLRPVSVMNGKWEAAEFKTSPVVLAVSEGMTPDAEFEPSIPGFIGIDEELLPKDIAGNVLGLSQENADGHVFAMIQSPQGAYVPFKVSTQNLTTQAIERVISLLAGGEELEVQKLVYSATPADHINSPRTSNKFLNILPTSTGSVLQFSSPSNEGRVLAADMSEVRAALNGNGQVMLFETMLVPGKKEGTFVLKRNTKLKQIAVNLKTELPLLLANKKFHVDKALLNTKRPFTSPLTGTRYPNYLEYLSSVDEGNGSAIVQTDAWGNGLPDGSHAGIFHRDIGLSFDTITVTEPVVATAQALPAYTAPDDSAMLFPGAGPQVPRFEVAGPNAPTPTVVEDKPLEATGQDLGSLGDFVFRTTDASRPYASMPRDMSGAISWLTERGFPPVITNYMQVVGGDRLVHGYFSQGAVAVWNRSDEGTEFHEGFHAVFRTFVRPSEQRSILGEAAYRYNMLASSDLEVEERLAEDFKHYMLTGEKPQDARTRNLFQRLLDFIKSYIFNKRTVDELFAQIETNTFNRTVQPTSLSGERVYSAKSMFSAKAQNEITDAIATSIINSTKENLNEKLRDIRLQFIQQAFLDKDTKTIVSPQKASEIYTKYIQGKWNVNGKISLPPIDASENVLVSSPQTFVQMMMVADGWEDIRSKDKYDNLLEKGWRTLAIEKTKHYGFRVSGDLDVFERIEDSLQEDKIFSKASVESSVKDTLSAPVRGFLMQIPQLDNDGKNIKNIIGGNVYVPFDTEVYPTLARLLQNSRQISEMRDRMQERVNEYPWLQYVLEAFENGLPNGSPKVPAHVFRAQFYPAMAMIEKNFIYVNNETEDSYVQGRRQRGPLKTKIISSNTANIGRSVAKRWESNAFKSKALGGSGLYQQETPGSAYTVNEAVKLQVVDLITKLQNVTPTLDLNSEEGKQQIANYKNLLYLLGAKLEGGIVERYLDLGDRLPGKKRKQLTGAALLHDIVNNKAQPNGQALSVLATKLTGETNIFNEEGKIIGRLTQGVSKFLVNPTLSFLSGDNKSIYAINLPTALDERLDRYLNEDKFSEAMLGDPYYAPDKNEHGAYTSWLLYGLRNDSNFQEVGKETLDVLKDKTSGQVDNTAFMELASTKELITRLSTFLGSGKSTMRVAFQTFSDRGKMDFLRLPRISYDSNLNATQFKNVEDLMLSYVLQDIMRARRANKEWTKAQQTGDTSELIANYHYSKKYDVKGRAFKFTQWDFLESLSDPKYNGSNAAKVLMTKALEADSSNAYLSSWEELSEMRTDVATYIKDFLSGQKKVLLDKFTELGIDPKKDLDTSLYGGDVDKMLSDFVLADTLTRNEISKLFAGDEAYYKSHEDFSKRFGILESPGYKSAEFSHNKMSDSETARYGDYGSFNTAFINDQYTSAESLDYVLSLSKYMSDDTIAQYKKGANKTDAMGYTTLDKHRAKLQGRGDWTRDHEKAYEEYKTTDEFSFTGKDGKVVYPPLTPIKTLTDSMFVHNGRVVRVIIKHSTFPLLKGITKSMPGLDSLREHLESQKGLKNKIDVINMDSTAKGSLWGNISLTAGEDGRFTNLANLVPITIRTRDERSPQIVPDTQADNPLMGSQFRKLLVTELNFAGSYKLSTGKSLTGQEVFANFNQVVSSMLDKSQQEMYDKLAYNPEVWTNTMARTEFFKRLRKDLAGGADARDLGDNFFKALKLIDVNGETDFEVPLSLPPIQRKIESMLLGKFRKDVMQQRINGFSAVQIAELGGSLIQTGEDIGKNGELKFVTLGKDDEGNDIIDHAEVAIPMDLAKKMGLKKNKLGEYDLSKVDPELLTLIGYRIPTQQKNSMLPMKIVRVLPKNVKAIMVPGFITKQMGSDFDVDKLFLMQKNYEEAYQLADGSTLNKVKELKAQLEELGYVLSSGEIKKLLRDASAIEEIQVGNASIGSIDTFAPHFKNLVDTLEAKLGNAQPTIRKVSYDENVLNNLDKEDYRERLENYFIDLSEAILRSPYHAAEMTASVDSDTLPNLATQAKEIDAKIALKKRGIENPTSSQIKAESTLSAQGILTEMTLSQRNKSGGAGIGMYATASTGFALGQYLKTPTRKLQLASNFAVRLNGKTLSDLTVTTGPESLGSHSVGYGYNERLGAAVDNAKDPMMAFLNDNAFTYPVINLFVRLGAGNENATFMVRQPIIKELSEYFINNEKTPDELGDSILEIAAKYDKTFKLPKATSSTTDLSIAKLKSSLELETSEDVEFQLDVLRNFYQYHRAGRMLSKVNKIANSDRISDMSSMAGIEEFQDIQSEITTPSRNPFIENADLALTNYQLVNKYQATINEAQTFAGNFFPYATDSMKSIKDSVRVLLNKANLKANVINNVNQDVAYYTFLRPGSPFKSLLTNVSKSTEDLMNGPNSVVIRLSVMQDKHKALANQRKPSGDKLLSRLRPSESNLDPANIVKTITFESSYSMSQYENNEITDAFLHLLNSKDEEDHNFAKDLVKYTLLSTGFTPSSDSLMEYIPMELWTDKRFYVKRGTDPTDSTITMAEFFRANPPSLNPSEQADFADKFIRNNSHVKGFVSVDKKLDVTQESFVAPKNKKYFNADMTNSPSQGWAGYIAGYNKTTKANVLYRFVSAEAEGATYERVATLGVPYKLKNYSDGPNVVNRVAASNLQSVPLTPQQENTLTKEQGNTFHPDRPGC